MLQLELPPGISEEDEWWLRKVTRRITLNDKGCWVWEGALVHTNPMARLDYKIIGIHRKLFEILKKGGSPLGKEQLLRCETGNARCVNPDHHRPRLGPGGITKAKPLEAAPTECVNGHPLTSPTSYYLYRKTGYRACRICRRESVNRYFQRLRAGQSLPQRPRRSVFVEPLPPPEPLERNLSKRERRRLSKEEQEKRWKEVWPRIKPWQDEARKEAGGEKEWEVMRLQYGLGTEKIHDENWIEALNTPPREWVRERLRGTGEKISFVGGGGEEEMIEVGDE